MEKTGVTWIVAADGSEARFFVEELRAGRVHELSELRMQAADERVASKPRATVHSRTGPGRHGAGDTDPRASLERRFLTLVAGRLVQGAERGAFDGLVLMAPPKALGTLRSALPPSLRSRVETDDPHERCHESVEAIRKHLRAARAKA